MIEQFPPVLGRRLGDRFPAGLLVTAVIAIILAVGFDLSSIASLGSVWIALVVFALVTAGHLRVRAETGARLPVLLVALASTVIVLVTFVFTTLVDEPATAVLLAVILVLSVGLDVGSKRVRDGRAHGRPDAHHRRVTRPARSSSRTAVGHRRSAPGVPPCLYGRRSNGGCDRPRPRVRQLSGTYLEPTAALLASRHRTYVPDLPGMGRTCGRRNRSTSPASPRR